MSVGMAVIKKTSNDKFQQECEGKGILVHCGWECKLVQPVWKNETCILPYVKQIASPGSMHETGC